MHQAPRGSRASGRHASGIVHFQPDPPVFGAAHVRALARWTINDVYESHDPIPERGIPRPARRGEASSRLWRDGEPPVPCGTPVFKTGAFGHSAISPEPSPQTVARRRGNCQAAKSGHGASGRICDGKQGMELEGQPPCCPSAENGGPTGSGRTEPAPPETADSTGPMPRGYIRRDSDHSANGKPEAHPADPA